MATIKVNNHKYKRILQTQEEHKTGACTGCIARNNSPLCNALDKRRSCISGFCKIFYVYKEKI